jgi:tetrapyrrole methylase family protein/MazG family protein
MSKREEGINRHPELTFPCLSERLLPWLSDNAENAYFFRGSSMSTKELELFQKLLNIMATLLGPEGCPWDREQTHRSLKPFLIEEAYEVNQTIDNADFQALKEELGDLLLQIVFHAELAKQANQFTMSDVLESICNKMINRHPHVFGSHKWKTPAEVLKNWEHLKTQEKPESADSSILAGIPIQLPALIRAHRIQDRAARVGFDWKHTHDVIRKVEEEFAELKASYESEDPNKIQDEFGDLLFALVNLSRFLSVHPEEALQKTISKFIRRFKYIEQKSREQNKHLKDMTLEEMDVLWEESKAAEE